MIRAEPRHRRCPDLVGAPAPPLAAGRGEEEGHTHHEATREASRHPPPSRRGEEVLDEGPLRVHQLDHRPYRWERADHLCQVIWRERATPIEDFHSQVPAGRRPDLVREENQRWRSDAFAGPWCREPGSRDGPRGAVRNHRLLPPVGGRAREAVAALIGASRPPEAGGSGNGGRVSELRRDPHWQAFTHRLRDHDRHSGRTGQGAARLPHAHPRSARAGRLAHRTRRQRRGDGGHGQLLEADLEPARGPLRAAPGQRRPM